MANGHGGAREGAGRRGRVDRHASVIVAAEKQVADHLPAVVDHLLDMASGRGERVQRTYEVAGNLTRKDVVRDAAGVPIVDGKGRPTQIEVLKFPDLDPDEEVLVKRIVTQYEPSVPAATYLADRVMGKVPSETDVTADQEAGLLAGEFDLEQLSGADIEILYEILGRALPRRSPDPADPQPDRGGAGAGPPPDPGSPV